MGSAVNATERKMNKTIVNENHSELAYRFSSVLVETETFGTSWFSLLTNSEIYSGYTQQGFHTFVHKVDFSYFQSF